MTNLNLLADRTAELKRLCDSLFANRRLILASNRGPVDHRITPDGRIEARRGSGGVVTALSSLSRMVEFTWIASAMGEGDRRVSQNGQATSIKSPLPGQKANLHYVVTPRRVYHKYYNVFCNPLLWFLQHYMWNSPYNPNVDASVHDSWYDGYVPVNEAFGKAIVQEVKASSDPPIVMVHDYHLYLVPTQVRASVPNAIIHYVNHIPWPTPRYWQLMPLYMRKAICQGLLSADVVGFQTPHDIRNFLDTCEEFVPEAEVDHSERSVEYQERRVLIRPYPISINVEEIRRIANSPRALEYEKKLSPLCNEKTIVRVDRAEPSKNVVRGFRAFRILLERYPEFRERVNFLAFLVPSRTHIRQYQRYLSEIEGIVADINNTFGSPDWQPITTFLENNYTQAISGMKLYDVLLVNAVIDGMNLVAKEGPVVNTKNGVLVISESTGASHQLWEGALTISPADIEGTMQAMYQALTMGAEERERRSVNLAQIVEREDIIHWMYRQLEDLSQLV